MRRTRFWGRAMNGGRFFIVGAAVALLNVIACGTPSLDPNVANAAAGGDMNAQFELAVAYDYGWGIAQDREQAATWYRRAADQGHAGAQNSLGSLYQFGQGVPQDFQLARHWYEAATQQGELNAINSLGYLYDLGLGVPEDNAKAVSLYTTAAESGNPEAMLNLGVMYAEGDGVPKDNVQAFMWLDLARFYTQRGANLHTKWHIRGVLDDYKTGMTQEEMKEGLTLARAWDQAHRK